MQHKHHGPIRTCRGETSFLQTLFSAAKVAKGGALTGAAHFIFQPHSGKEFSMSQTGIVLSASPLGYPRGCQR
jgi:hypothetical protein